MKYAIMLTVLLTASSCSALEIENVTYDYNLPGTLRIKYTGVKKVIIDEIRDFFEDEWRSDADTLFNSGQISLSQYRNSLRQLRYVRSRYGYNGSWWQRSWFHSYPLNKGGAPPLRRFTVGRTGDIIDLGIARINENFRFKFKEYKVDITRRWRFRFKPRVTASTKNIVSRAAALFIFDYSVRRRRVMRFVIEVGYKTRLKEFVEFRIEMFNL